ncbi:MAG: hypothetical protein WBY53_12435, partial [Acidobacteriaceae bacterium]
LETVPQVSVAAVAVAAVVLAATDQLRPAATASSVFTLTQSRALQRGFAILENPTQLFARLALIEEGDCALKTLGQTNVHRWWPFVLLVLLGASRWAVAAARPDADSTLTSLTIGCAWAALLSLAFAVLQPKPRVGEAAITLAARLRWLLSGALLFGGPAITLLVSARDLDSSALTIALALTPLVVAIASSALGTESSEGIAGRIWPSLAAVAGLLLVLVQPNLGDLRTDLALVVAPLITGIGAALFCRDQPRSPSRSATALLGACALFALALAERRVVAGVHPSLSLFAIASDGLIALLSIITLAQLGAPRWSSQFTWIPLLIILEGIVLVRPTLTTHWFVGLILLIVAGIYLLLPQEDDTPPEPSPAPHLPV